MIKHALQWIPSGSTRAHLMRIYGLTRWADITYIEGLLTELLPVLNTCYLHIRIRRCLLRPRIQETPGSRQLLRDFRKGLPDVSYLRYTRCVRSSLFAVVLDCWRFSAIIVPELFPPIQRHTPAHRSQMPFTLKLVLTLGLAVITALFGTRSGTSTMFWAQYVALITNVLWFTQSCPRSNSVTSSLSTPLFLQPAQKLDSGIMNELRRPRRLSQIKPNTEV